MDKKDKTIQKLKAELKKSKEEFEASMTANIDMLAENMELTRFHDSIVESLLKLNRKVQGLGYDLKLTTKKKKKKLR